jgi:hypothetical protein
MGSFIHIWSIMLKGLGSLPYERHGSQSADRYQDLKDVNSRLPRLDDRHTLKLLGGTQLGAQAPLARRIGAAQSLRLRIVC